MSALQADRNPTSRAGRHGVNKPERDLVARLDAVADLDTYAAEDLGIVAGLTDAGLDRLAMCEHWGEVPQQVLPADVVQAANAGEGWRMPAPGEVGRLHQAWSKRLAEARLGK